MDADRYKGRRIPGQFDGGGNSITGMTIDSASDHVGLFGITKGGTLEQIKLENLPLYPRALVMLMWARSPVKAILAPFKIVA